ncbi:MAG: N-acetylmuramoyl-L-alanine amidase [Dysgonamonadaceae bacterium]|jgi:N-acetylmuramoyl-L-alanine amidase|nr:N-acetylmuramoyl-L-alanine amidase [Dysgonamonadaceae bacterium]
MKQLHILLCILFTSLSGYATDLTGVKIYVNPGHGGHDSDDRNVVTIPFSAGDAAGFWESNSNLTKGLALRDLLLSANATVLMSRTTNTTVDDRNLSEIAEEANANNVDAFLSIHSNAANASANYLLLLYCGTDGNPNVTASIPMAQAAWQRLFPNELTNWTAYSLTSPNIRGDMTFYGYNLGVLRPLTVPGFLSEGSFHDYKPETHRLLNADYCKLEAIRFYRYFHDYFEKDLPQTSGEIAGWVKSENERINHPLFTYNAGTSDQWLPLNGATVKLLDASGVNVLKTYITDDYYNGIFTFYDLAPGNYKLSFEATDYDAKTIDITVSAEQTAFAKTFLRNNNVPEPEGGYPDYPEPNQEAGVLPMNQYPFTQTAQNLNPAWLNGAGIKRTLYRNDKIYVLTTEPKIYVINANSATLDVVVKELDLTGITDGVTTISDIAFTADGYLLACNKENIAYTAPTTYWKVYTWDDDNAAPALLFQTQAQANWSEGTVGETFTVSGARKHLKCYTTAVTTGAAKQIRVMGLEYETGVAQILSKYMMDVANYTEAIWSEHPVFTISPSGDGDHFYLDSETLLPAEYQFDWAAADRSELNKKAEFAADPAYNLHVIAGGSAFFRHAKHLYMAAPVCESDASKVGVVLFDITDGLHHALKVSDKYPAEGLGTSAASYMAAAAKVDAYDIELLVWAKNQGIARYKTQAADPKANIFASELSYANGDFSFTLNENAAEVVLELYNEADEIAESYNLGALAKGAHRIHQEYTTASVSWGITAGTSSVDRPVLLTTASQLPVPNPIGLAVDNSFTSPFFGRVYATSAGNSSKGVFIFNSALADVTGQGTAGYAGNIAWATDATYGSISPTRLAIAVDGTIYITDYTDTHGGVWIMNPATPSANFTPVFTPGIGNTAVHGCIPSAYIEGAGANTKLYTFDENSGGNVLRYDIGNLSGLWTTPPSAVIYNDAANGNLQVNLNSCIIPDGQGGWWISQARAAGANTKAVPSLIHFNGTSVDFNSGEGDFPNIIIDSDRAAMAVNSDKTRLAMGSASEVLIFDITFDENGIPVLQLVYTITHGLNRIWSVDFDVAGNIYVAGYNSNRLAVWALPKADNSFTTPAPVRLGTTGLPTVSTGDRISVYPNPAVSDITIAGNGIAIESYILYDTNGRRLRTGAVKGEQTSVALSGLNAGIYILQVKTAEGLVIKRIIKK